MKIRKEKPEDYLTVYQLVQSAFETADFADGNEQEIVAKLRKSDAFIPQLSLVAETNGKLVGHILFTKGKVGTEEVLVLAPLAILPEYQRRGIGQKLIEEGHQIGKKLGYTFSVVFGSETYYPRFGYLPAVDFGVALPEGFPSMNFMAVPLTESVPKLNGEMIYAKEFGL